MTDAVPGRTRTVAGWRAGAGRLPPVLSLSLAALVPAACGGPPAAGATIGHPATAPRVEPAASLDRLTRADFNRLAVRLDAPVFWVRDGDADGAVDPGEIARLLFYPPAPAWVDGDGFTPAFLETYEAMVAEAEVALAGDDPETTRQRLVREDLDQGLPTLLEHDFSGLTDWERAFVRRMLRVAELVDALYAEQLGVAGLGDRIPATDRASRALLRRNWGPACAAPRTEALEHCTAIPGLRHPPQGIYPAALQTDGYCQRLEARPDAATLLSPFTVVRGDDRALRAVPYHEAFAAGMAPIAEELRAAAEGIPAQVEDPLRAYLRAAALGFETNDWEPANEAWAAMNVRNSSWYLRVGPDEVYWDRCSQKAGFHVTFARINRGSLVWQDRLAPLQQDMERAIADRSARTYRPRSVSFHLPDFIDIVVNAGDDRGPFGATVGQSLPNWGRVADEGRGRTVAMTNLYTDPDSLRLARERAAMVLVPEAMALVDDDPLPGLLSTILHEATHNLGPAHDYRYRGKTDGEAFGGELASMLEELKAQSGALFLLPMLVERGLIEASFAERATMDSVLWALGHVARGMYTPEGQRRAYSQLSAVQIGFLMDRGVLRFDPDARAANGADVGAFRVDFSGMPAVAAELMGLVVRIKATNDRSGAEDLVARYVDSDRVPQRMLADRFTRLPRQSFVYADPR